MRGMRRVNRGAIRSAVQMLNFINPAKTEKVSLCSARERLIRQIDVPRRPALHRLHRDAARSPVSISLNVFLILAIVVNDLSSNAVCLEQQLAIVLRAVAATSVRAHCDDLWLSLNLSVPSSTKCWDALQNCGEWSSS